LQNVEDERNPPDSISPDIGREPEEDVIVLPALEGKLPDPDTLSTEEKQQPELEPENDETIHWSSFACELGLQGLAQEIALNSTLESLQQDYLCLNLSNELLDLVNPTIEDEIRQAVENKLGVSLKLEMLALDELEMETPQQFKQRVQQDHKLATIEAIKQDEVVKKLNDAFGAELIEASVTKIDV
jgi:DNA polymerase-3 subunit gamma/tau